MTRQAVLIAPWSSSSDMPKFLDDFDLNGVVKHCFETTDGATLYALISGAVAVYAAGSTSAITDGITLTSYSSGARLGQNDIVIDLSASGGASYPQGDYVIALTAGTVNGTSVAGRSIAEFSVNRHQRITPQMIQIDGNGNVIPSSPPPSGYGGGAVNGPINITEQDVSVA